MYYSVPCTNIAMVLCQQEIGAEHKVGDDDTDTTHVYKHHTRQSVHTTYMHTCTCMHAYIVYILVLLLWSYCFDSRAMHT